MRVVALLIFTLMLVAACGGGGGASSDDSKTTMSSGADTGELDGDSAEVEETWPEKWCAEAQPGMTLDELVAIMGEPEEVTGLGTASWFSKDWVLSAFFDANGRAENLDAYQIADDAKPLSCSTHRTL